jgi:hypothetical protein
MPTSTSRLSYPDCENFLSTALDDELGARLPFTTRGAARQFQVRLHSFRQICRMDNKKIYQERDHPLHGRSEFDPLEITIQGPDNEGGFWIYARKRQINEGVIESLSELEQQGDE